MEEMKIIKFLSYLSNLFITFMPLIIITVFINKLNQLSCIEIVDKLYLLLGATAIITYWTMNFRKGDEK